MPSGIITSLSNNALFSFTLLLSVSLIVPPIFERIKLPGLIGLLIAGIVLGNNGLGLLNPDSETIDLFSDIGKIYLMFVAGLEINLAEFRKTQSRSLGFGLLTFLMPLMTGIAIGLFFGFSLNSSVLIGSLFASHTLLAYPIVNRLGIITTESITVTIGATIFTDIAALLVLAICIAISQGDFSWLFLSGQISMLILYSLLVLFGLSRLGREFFKRNGDDEGNQFLFVLLTVFLASVGAQVINVDKIVGAFLAGLAVNDVVGRSPVEEKIEFVGSTLFIPFFFIGMGLLLDIPAFINNLRYELPLTASIVIGLLGSKFLAAAIAKFLYRYSWIEALTMWSLSIPQVAATLAAALIGFRAGVLTESVFNAVIVLMFVTVIVGPILTKRFGSQIAVPVTSVSPLETAIADLQLPYKVIVPIANPHTRDNLIEAAALIAQGSQSILMPLVVVTSQQQMDDPLLEQALRVGGAFLQTAIARGETFDVTIQPKIRIDDDTAAGISRVAREENAQLIVMGWSRTESLKARLFGTAIQTVCWSAHCPVMVVRLLTPPHTWQRILVPIKSLAPQDLQIIFLIQRLAIANQAHLTLLHVSEPWTTKNHCQEFKIALQNILQEAQITIPVEIKVLRYSNIAKAVLHQAAHADLVVLHSTRYRTAGGLAVGDLTSEISSQLHTSLLVFNDF